ncbi:hypothetical protein MLTONO_6051 [Mesorhizobium loti]|nr:hypothetical protein MLTONO_6051 [Mesorhizobium loti]
MTKLKLATIADDKPVKITVELSATLPPTSLCRVPKRSNTRPLRSMVSDTVSYQAIAGVNRIAKSSTARATSRDTARKGLGCLPDSRWTSPVTMSTPRPCKYA